MLITIGTFLLSFVSILAVSCVVGWVSLFIWASVTVFLHDNLGLNDKKSIVLGFIFAFSVLTASVGATVYTLFWR